MEPEIEYIPAKTIVTKTKHSGWFGIDYNMNIYRGCSHGCIYCDSRSECYNIKNFDIVKAKENALMIIRNDLRRKVKTGVVGTGAMSDPYNPFERDCLFTRNALELINAYGFGAAIATKSDLVTRDIDILEDIKAHSPVLVKITVTTSDDELCRLIEPRASLSSERFCAIARLSEKNIFAGVLLMPVLPYLTDNDENILNIINLAHESGARFIYPAFGVTLRQNQREWYFKKLDEHFPGLKQKYIKRYGNCYECHADNVKRLWSLFAEECGKRNILYNMKDIIAAYKAGYSAEQISLF